MQPLDTWSVLEPRPKPPVVSEILLEGGLYSIVNTRHYMAATKVFSDFAILLGGLPPRQTPPH